MADPALGQVKGQKYVQSEVKIAVISLGALSLKFQGCPAHWGVLWYNKTFTCSIRIMQVESSRQNEIERGTRIFVSFLHFVQLTK